MKQFLWLTWQWLWEEMERIINATMNYFHDFGNDNGKYGDND